jgi:cellulose synthase/poly-beta-1,6-N-acetylglucosamine synthase-like glycosyltransferase
MRLVEVIFWISLGLISYVYIGYPCLLVLWRMVRQQGIRKSEWEPSVTIIIAAWNERSRLRQKIDNCLQLDYPRDKLQVVVSLDGPTDGSEEIVRGYADAGIEMVHTLRHNGKAAALNAATEVARGDVLVFSDARQALDPSAIRELVSNFSDDSVGVVSGELILVGDDGSDDIGSNLYWTYEKQIRALESQIHSILGATGALYAIRRELHAPIPELTILDDVAIPMRAVLRGKRAIFEPGARVYDRPYGADQEYRRKVRTLMGNYQLIALMPEILSPLRNPVFVQFISHKVGRLLVPYFLVSLLASNVLLRDGLYGFTLLIQCLFYLAAFGGSRLARRSRVQAVEVG